MHFCLQIIASSTVQWFLPQVLDTDKPLKWQEITLLCGRSRSPSGCHPEGTGSSTLVVFLTHPTALYRCIMAQEKGLRLVKFRRWKFVGEMDSYSPDVHLRLAIGPFVATHLKTLVIVNDTTQGAPNTSIALMHISKPLKKGNNQDLLFPYHCLAWGLEVGPSGHGRYWIWRAEQHRLRMCWSSTSKSLQSPQKLSPKGEFLFHLLPSCQWHWWLCPFPLKFHL